MKADTALAEARDNLVWNGSHSPWAGPSKNKVSGIENLVIGRRGMIGKGRSRADGDIPSVIIHNLMTKMNLNVYYYYKKIARLPSSVSQCLREEIFAVKNFENKTQMALPFIEFVSFSALTWIRFYLGVTIGGENWLLYRIRIEKFQFLYTSLSVYVKKFQFWSNSFNVPVLAKVFADTSRLRRWWWIEIGEVRRRNEWW